MFKGLGKVGLVLGLTMSSLSASVYTAVIYCDVAGVRQPQPGFFCIKEIIVDGKKVHQNDTRARMIGTKTYISLNNSFSIEVKKQSGNKDGAVLIIKDSKGNEVYNKTEWKKYSSIHVTN